MLFHRPEKDHRAQLLSFSSFLKLHPEYRDPPVKLVLVGGSRNDEDAARVDGLRLLAEDLQIKVECFLVLFNTFFLTRNPGFCRICSQCSVFRYSGMA